MKTIDKLYEILKNNHIRVQKVTRPDLKELKKKKKKKKGIKKCQTDY